MLGHFDAIATLAVSDLRRSRRFYEDLLGLAVEMVDENSGVVRYRSGTTALLIYESQFAGTNQATAINFAVRDEVDIVTRTLARKGIVFERYEGGGARHEGDVHVWGDFRTAWFKDPDGNILSLVSSAA